MRYPHLSPKSNRHAGVVGRTSGAGSPVMAAASAIRVIEYTRDLRHGTLPPMFSRSNTKKWVSTLHVH
ncbi:hypothetical protein AWB82_04470 [Caballeronia glebae]|uniref:Uncharacterized protein n=1 Tax=Caballeronia glebae TaxID=1777143 RepID=A0A158BRX0_9BURK|nr:hypothetical protein AWB82_04470 [Caballeronia glebae]